MVFVLISVAPSSAVCIEPVVSTDVFATEQRSMPQECVAQSGCMVFVRPTSKRVVCPSWKRVGTKHSDTGPRRGKLRRRHLNSGEKMCELYLPRGLDLLVMCWLQKYSNNICVCTNWRASMTGFVSQMGFLVWGLCINCMQCYGHTSRCCMRFLAMKTHTSAPPGAYESTGR